MVYWNRFISYIYRYHDGHKCENSGFAKVAKVGRTGRLTVGLRNGMNSREEIYGVFIYRETLADEGAVGGEQTNEPVMIPLPVLVGKMRLRNGHGEECFYQLHRSLGPGVFSACLALIMSFHPPGKAVCPPSVKRAVCTLNDICIIHSGLLFCEIFYVKTATNISSAAVLLYSSSRHSSCISLTSKNKAGWDSGCGFSHLLYYTFISYFCEYGIRLISYGSSSMTIITGFS